ncbi:MAG: hypothetical protein MdMp014T_1172 [Treponematales bacterium]
MKKIKSLFIAAAVISAAFGFALLGAACDMVRVVGPSVPQMAGPDEEPSGKWLKVIHLPLNTQVQDFQSAQVLNSVSVIAQMKGNITIVKGEESCTAYIPLACTSGAEFTETGPLYITLSLYIDALTWIDIKEEHKVIVQFTDGRGTLDVLSLSSDTGAISDNWPAGNGTIVSEGDPGIEQMEREGRYLKVLHLPLNTQPKNFSSASVYNSQSSPIGKYDKKNALLIVKGSSDCYAYIPLVYSSGGTEFVETGSFYVQFAFYIDALTWIDLRVSHKVIVEFAEGRGTLDVLSLASVPGAVSNDWPATGSGGGSGSGGQSAEEIKAKIEELKQNGHYIELYHLPRETLASHILSLSVSNGTNTVARPDSSSSILIERETTAANVYIPLVSSDGSLFTCLLFFYLCKSAPGLAQSLLTGTPSLSAAGAVGAVAGAAGAVAGTAEKCLVIELRPRHGTGENAERRLEPRPYLRHCFGFRAVHRRIIGVFPGPFSTTFWVERRTPMGREERLCR